MEQITKRDGRYYYGQHECSGIDDVYRRFRHDYHESLGKEAFKRLNRLGSRRERVHEFGFVFDDGPVNVGVLHGLVPTRLLGLSAGSYCRMLGGWDIPGGMDDEQVEKWIDWVFSKDSKCLRLVGMNQKAGRTDSKINKRYR